MIDIIPNAVEREEVHNIYRELPDNDSLFKCHKCKTIFDIYYGGISVLM